MLKTILHYILAGIILIGLCYTGIWFITGNPNVYEWSQYSRLYITIFGIYGLTSFHKKYLSEEE
jgi:drug/metabolite transporter superfamily protein YnfA